MRVWRFWLKQPSTEVSVALPAKRPDLVPLVVLVSFAGLRPSEAARLEWKEVGDDYIRLPGKKSKTGHSRQIPIQPNLKSWLALWRKDNGLICPDLNLEHVNPSILRHSGVRLPYDGLRHGYGTHRQRIIKNIGAVAEEMGNSIAICRRHYVNAFCTDAEANEWFSLVPQNPANIIALPDGQTEADTTNTGEEQRKAPVPGL
jgi:integrase